MEGEEALAYADPVRRVLFANDTFFLTEHRILEVLSLWIEKHGMLQEEDPQLVNRLRSFFLNLHIPLGSTVGVKQLLQTLDRKVGSFILQNISSDSHRHTG
jgi:hypothetical protein